MKIKGQKIKKKEREKNIASFMTRAKAVVAAAVAAAFVEKIRLTVSLEVCMYGNSSWHEEKLSPISSLVLFFSGGSIYNVMVSYLLF